MWNILFALVGNFGLSRLMNILGNQPDSEFSTQ
jgi:hypothetical protein